MLIRGLVLAVAAAAAALFAALPAAAAWRKAESDNFIVYSQASEGKIREQVALLEDYNSFLRMLTGVTDPTPPNKLPVYLVRGQKQLREVRHDIPAQVAGFYRANPAGIAAFADDRAGGWGAGEDQVLLHEIAHHFMMQHRPAAYPAWFVEGFAEYVSTASFKPNLIEFGQASPARASWLARAQWLPFDRILFEPPPRTKEEGALFYAQSWLLTHYLMRDEVQKEKFKAFLRARFQGVAPQKAFADSFGIEPKELEKTLRTYGFRKMTYTRMKRASAAVAPKVTVTPLPASADDLLLLKAALDVGFEWGVEQQMLARIRAAAARHPADAFAQRVLVQAEVLHGDPARGEALLDGLLKAAPQDGELMYLKGMRYLVEGRRDDDKRRALFKQARTWFARAHKADPDHFQTLARYGESLRLDESFDSDNTMNIVLLAHELAPQVAEFRMNAANLLLLRGKPDVAEALLMPLAADPHNTGLAAEAQRLLEKARAAQKAAPGAAPKPVGE
jgi:tetratricopeptide (TPR) repeat protein